MPILLACYWHIGTQLKTLLIIMEIKLRCQSFFLGRYGITYPPHMGIGLILCSWLRHCHKNLNHCMRKRSVAHFFAFHLFLYVVDLVDEIYDCSSQLL